MTLALCIDTADAHSHVVLGDETGVLALRDHGRDMDTAVFLPQAVRAVLADAGRTLTDIDLVAVNIGPGGLSATRCGVSFANALAFALGKPILGVDNLSLLGRRAWVEGGAPVVCVKRAANAHAYAALYDGAAATHLVFGPAPEAVAAVVAQGGAGAVIAGDGGAVKDPALAGRLVSLDGPERGLAPHLLELVWARLNAAGTEPVEPLNEVSPLFSSPTQERNAAPS
jgi:tRNA threonylcarbamoyl adenosine modification protein YeaZ